MQSLAPSVVSNTVDLRVLGFRVMLKVIRETLINKPVARVAGEITWNFRNDEGNRLRSK